MLHQLDVVKCFINMVLVLVVNASWQLQWQKQRSALETSAAAASPYCAV